MRILTFCIWGLSALVVFSCGTTGKKRNETGPKKIEILFLGHNSEHHNSAAFMPMLGSALAKEGINLTYTADPEDLNAENLSWYDGLMIYANHDSITSNQEDALLDFVEEGKGFIPVHCASFCFRNSSEYVALVGGQFHKHETDTFTAKIMNREHPTMDSLLEFSTWDETYVHHKLSDDRTVLMERVDGTQREPWTWTKTHGKGRVFYTAYGHDERTWNNPGFHQLMKQGIVWAVGDKVKQQWDDYKKEIPTLVYKEVDNIPNYEKRNPAPKYQEPLSPEESKKLIQVPPQFDLELFASEPDIINPIAMDWDEKGRLWVIETVDYPNTVRDDKGQGDDRIKICEDTNGDGKADKFTVFADKLNIPTSLTFANGGVIVSQAPHFLFLKDTDGDDKADIKTVIMEGWGVYDTHAGPSNLRYGFDNNIWGSVGYSGFEGTISGELYKFRQGLYRFLPDLSKFEFMTSTSNNTWGLGFNEHNDVFASTANNTHSVYMGIPNTIAKGVEGINIGSSKIDGHYAMHPVTDKVRQVDVFGGFTAAAGHSFYNARNYPETYWGNVAFVCEPTGHLVHIARIEKDGAGFKEKDGWNLFAGADEWVSPVEAKVGPDGAVWVLDWYNFIIQHNPTPTQERGGYAAENGDGNAYENPLRDKSHGRVWRVVYKNAKPYEPIALSKDKPDELVEALKNDNHFWRMTAQRLLVESGNTAILPDLYALAESEDLDQTGNNFPATHALWTIDGLNVLSKNEEARNVVTMALKHKSPAVRKAATQILSHVVGGHSDIIASGVMHDTEPNTRLAAVLSLAGTSASDKIGQLLFDLSHDEIVKKDEWLSKAVYAAATYHANGFINAFMVRNPDYNKTDDAKKVVDREAKDLDDRAWKEMKLPSYLEQAGLDMDGVVWFRKAVEISSGSVNKNATISLGPIDDSDVTYINGVKIGGTEKAYSKKRNYKVPAGVLKAGKNSIAIRVDDTGGNGGIYGKEDELFFQIGGEKIPLSGAWKYDIEKQYRSANNNVFEDTSIGEVFIQNYADKAQSTDDVAGTIGADVTKIKMSVIKNEMKYDLKSFTVVAGKPVEIAFTNPDFMQHNLVITKPGMLETVGKAADKLASNPKGAEMQYVPDLPEVLFSTPLVNPQNEVKLTFIAPTQPGDYPFVCTFPGHWSIMNGTMKVVKSSSIQ